MHFNIIAALVSFWIVLLSEMGDRTQLIAVAFAARHKVYKVVLVVIVATVINFAITVIIGTFIAHVPVFNSIAEIMAAVSFLIFGVVTLKKEEESSDDIKTGLGSFLALTLAFFLAEFGDKSEITTFALSAKFLDSPLSVFTGSALGMITGDCAGIAAGFFFLKKVPAEIIRYAAAAILIVFGLFDSFQISRLIFKLGLYHSIVIVFAEVLLLSVIIFLYVFRTGENAG